MQKRKREDSATPGDGLPIDAGIDAQQPRRGFQQPTMQPNSTLVSSAFDSDFSLDLPMSSGKEPPSGTAFDFANLWESFGGQLGMNCVVFNSFRLCSLIIHYLQIQTWNLSSQVYCQRRRHTMTHSPVSRRV